MISSAASKAIRTIKTLSHIQFYFLERRVHNKKISALRKVKKIAEGKRSSF